MPQESLKHRQESDTDSIDDLSPVARAKLRLNNALGRLESAVESRLQHAVAAEQSARAAAHEASQAAARISSDDNSAWEAKLSHAMDELAVAAEEKDTLRAELAQSKSEQRDLHDALASVSKTLDQSIGKIESLLKE